MRRQLGWGDDETVVLHSGAMGVKQGLETVVEAARLADAQSRPIRFVLLGDGGRRRILEESAAGCRSLQFVDPLPGDAYAQALHAADILLVNEKPGLVEMAVPSKLTSYFSTGRPVVAATEATSTTAAEVAASGAGVRIEPGAPDLLLRTCINLGSDPDRSQTLGARGPAYCATVLAEDAALDAYDAWVRTLARKGLA
jgi:glycosyltransferase involved in cell wall biosynthesis